MAKAIFLDRDGTINDHTKDYVKSWDQFKFLPNSLEAISKLADSNYLIIIVTNQTVVERGLISMAGLEEIHERMVAEIEKAHGRIDKIYTCTHLPDEKCDCRKPGTLMLEMAERDFGIDLSQSWFIGDNTKDIKCGNDAGCSTILVETGWGGKDGLYDAEPTFRASDLLEAVSHIL